MQSIRKTSPAAEVVWFGRNEGDLEKFMSATENDSNVRAVSIADGAADAIRNAIENCTVHTDAPLSEGAQTDEYTSGKREGIEWTNLRFRDANLSDYREGKKRILFVGDSISWGYGDQMDGKIDMTMDYVRTSRGADDIALIRELEFMFAQYRYDYIHINIGLHDRGLSASDYASEMRKLLKKIQSSEATAKILFTNTTDKAVLVGNEWLHDSKGNAVIEQMNEEIYGVCQEMNIPYNDLYSFVTENELKKIDSLHFAEAGYERMATQISAFIRANIS